MANLITGQTHHYGQRQPVLSCGRQRRPAGVPTGLESDTAGSWEGSAVLGVPPTRALPWFPPLALCRGSPHSRFAVVPPTRALPWFPPLALCRGFPHSRFAWLTGADASSAHRPMRHDRTGSGLTTVINPGLSTSPN
ncbi:MAG: hypothetical protein F6K52_08660 [Moorea sp. SIO3H5]|nr:hypothetical protein [Moorena sp. SIO3H5]